MAFRGIYPPPELTPAPGGLLGVARVMSHTAREYDERWVRGFSYEFDSQPTAIRLLTTHDENIVGGELYDGSDSDRFLEYTPFFIESESFQSTLGLTGEDRFKRVKAQLEAATQKAVETELWDGAAAQSDPNGSAYLTKNPTVAAIGAFDPFVALYYLEQAIANSPTGESGVIHVTRDIASILGSRILYKNIDNSGHLITRLGTPVVVGSGYSGNGPDDDANAEASATNKWMYATGSLDVHLGKTEVVNENLAQGADVTINDMRIKALRPAAVYFDPSIYYTVRVTLPTT